MRYTLILLAILGTLSLVGCGGGGGSSSSTTSDPRPRHIIGQWKQQAPLQGGTFFLFQDYYSDNTCEVYIRSETDVSLSYNVYVLMYRPDPYLVYGEVNLINNTPQNAGTDGPHGLIRFPSYTTQWSVIMINNNPPIVQAPIAPSAAG